MYQHSQDKNESEMFKPIIDEANSLQQTIVLVYKIGSNIYANVAKVANKVDYRLLLIGHKDSIFSSIIFGQVFKLSNRLRDKSKYVISKLENHKILRNTIFAPIIYEDTRTVLSKGEMPVGIFIDRSIVGIKTVFVPIFDEEDIFIGDFMERLEENS